MNPEFNGMKMNRVSICSGLPLQAVLGPLRRYVASGFRLKRTIFCKRRSDPLIYSHVTPYGTFRLDMSQRLAIEQDAVAA